MDSKERFENIKGNHCEDRMLSFMTMGALSIGLLIAIIIVNATGSNDFEGSSYKTPELFLFRRKPIFCLPTDENCPTKLGARPTNIIEDTSITDLINKPNDFDWLNGYNSDLSVKRNGNDVHYCECIPNMETYDLGYMHFPRYILQAKCDTKCPNGLKCVGIQYELQYLEPRANADHSDDNPEAEELLQVLKKVWRSQKKLITVGCKLSKHYN